MLLTITEAMRELRIKSRETIRAMMRDGRLEAVNLNPDGGRPTWRVKIDGLLNGDPAEAAAWEDLKRRAGIA